MPVAALVLGILGVLFSLIPGFGYFVGVPLSLVALILGVVGRKAAAANGQPTGAATGGLVLGIIGLVFGLLMFIACAVCMKAASDGAKEFEKQMKDPAFKGKLGTDPEFKKMMDDIRKLNKEVEAVQPPAAPAPAPEAPKPATP